MQKIREQLVKHLKGGEAFMAVEKMLDKISFEKLGEKPSGLPYSFYSLFYHMWYAQQDILEYCKAEDYKESNWPKDYWPQNEAPDTEAQWKELQQAFFDNRKELSSFLLDSKNQLLLPVRTGTDHTLLREVLLVIEHNAYHTGQLLVVLRELGLYAE
ncbi:DinB family protein [Antarcticibacterium sp. 1MA-6-2]|uniref:DinB family protein n=1 Tax=Antarcticibacterium sp. 1MA-6-2 TaxID=2908210 RepID=UPI001F1A501D|nr:DinB family protein [Antarcticibacterium sp. 1MA-6-2]UJH92268.1 DinB family protein [Antarcticibacterium sp. 1MA-6-2]